MKNQAREVGTVLNADEIEQVSGAVAMLVLTPLKLTPLVLTPIAAQPLAVLAPLHVFPAGGNPWALIVLPMLRLTML